MGASVLHEEAVFPVREAGIPLVIKNTNAPQDPGTIISETADEGEAEPIITGVTGKRGFVAINVARDRTKPRVGFMRRALSVFERYDVSVEHMPTGVDRFGAVVQEQDVHDSLYSLVGDIQQEVEPLEIEVVEGLALIATVGRNLRGRAGISGHLFGMLGQAGVSVRMISQSCDEINIIIGVEEKDFDQLASLMADCILRGREIKADVERLRAGHTEMRYCFDDAAINDALEQLAGKLDI